MLCFKIGSCFTTLMGKYNVVFDRSIDQSRERERERERESSSHMIPLSTTVRKIPLATLTNTLGVIKDQYNIITYRRRTNRHRVNQTLHINKRLSNMNSLRPVLSRRKGSSCSNSGTRRRTIVK